jgi:hypothetical protein
MNGYLLHDSMRRATARDIFKLACSCALVLAGVPLTAAAQEPRRRHGGRRIGRGRRHDGIQARGDIAHLPAALKNSLIRMDARPHRTYEPMRAFAEADKPSQLFQYYLLNSAHFQPNIFTSIVPGINDHAIPTAANAANHQLPTIGAVRVVLEPKPGLPTDPKDVEAFIDIFTDLSGLFVINNESGWYEGWMIHDLIVPAVAPPRADGHAQFGKMTSADAAAIAGAGDASQQAGQFLHDRRQRHALPELTGRVPEQTGECRFAAVEHGRLQLPATKRLPRLLGVQRVHQLDLPAVRAGLDWRRQRRLSCRPAVRRVVADPGSGPSGVSNDESPLKQKYGDNPNNPRDPDRGPTRVRAIRIDRSRTTRIRRKRACGSFRAAWRKRSCWTSSCACARSSPP